jgi:hypothetical protein
MGKYNTTSPAFMSMMTLKCNTTALGLFLGDSECQNQSHKQNPPSPIFNLSHCELLINSLVAEVCQAAVKPTALAHGPINAE